MIPLVSILCLGLIFCAIEYVVANGVFVAPSFFAILTISASIVFAIFGELEWNVEISYDTIFVVFIGFTAMLAADILAKKTSHRKKYTSIEDGVQAIEINSNKVRLVVFATVVLTALYCLDIVRAGSAMGFSGLSAIYAVKINNSGTSLLIRQGVKIVMAVAFVHIFIFVNNFMIVKRKFSEQWMHIVPVLCGCLCCIFTSIRTDILRIVVAFVVDYCILTYQSRAWKRSSLNRVVRKIMPLMIGMALLLTSVRYIVKGTANATSNTYNIIQYIAYYIGTPIVVLGSKIETGIHQFQGNVVGEMTFNQVWFFLERIGLVNNVNLQAGSKNVWISEADRITANVDTIFGPPYIDFGLLGMAIYIFVLFLLLGKFYYKYINKSAWSYQRNTKLIYYSYFATIPAMAYYTNLVNQFLTVYLVSTLVLMALLIRFYKIQR